MTTIPGFTRYEITKDGRIFRKTTTTKQYQPSAKKKVKVVLPRKELKTYKPQRYHVCYLINDKGVKRTCLLHRLLAITFIPNPLGADTINHIDGNRDNNAIENLEWCTQQDNVTHAWTTGLSKALPTGYKGKKVGQYDENMVLLKTFPSTQSVTKEGFSQSCVWNCCAGKQKTHKGFKWMFI